MTQFAHVAPHRLELRSVEQLLSLRVFQQVTASGLKTYKALSVNVAPGKDVEWVDVGLDEEVAPDEDAVSDHGALGKVRCPPAGVHHGKRRNVDCRVAVCQQQNTLVALDEFAHEVGDGPRLAGARRTPDEADIALSDLL